MKPLSYSLVLTLFILASGCSLISAGGGAAEKVKILEYTRYCSQKGCPDFILSVFQTGHVTYEGKAYTSLMGTHLQQLPEAQWTTLKQSIESANLWRIPEEFPISQFYAPVTLIRIFEGEYTKTIRGQELPYELALIVSQLDQITNNGGWKLIAPPTYGLAKGIVPNLLRIQLQTNVNFEYWQSKYYEYSLSMVKNIPEGNNYWLFRFDPSRIQPLAFKELLDIDPDVMKSEFEKTNK
jgi:hypothetical protein